MSENMEKYKQIFAQGSETAGWNGCIIHDALYHINDWLKCYDMFITGVIPIAIGGVAVYCTVQALKETRENAESSEEQTRKQLELLQKQAEITEKQAHEATIINAWNVLTTPAPGNSGKKEAIETLAKAGKMLGGIDLSTERNGGVVELEELNVSGANLNDAKFNGKWDKEKNKWENGADLLEARFNNVRLFEADFRGANLEYAQFQDVDLRITNFNGARVGGVQFQDAWLSYSSFRGANLAGAKFHSDCCAVAFHEAIVGSAEFHGANLSRAQFAAKDGSHPVIFLKTVQFKDCWVHGKTEENATQNFPILPQGWKAVLTGETHKNEKGQINGYYINIVRVEN
jgi:uncharacterized protein YjbI with pentapeptide repeats